MVQYNKGQLGQVAKECAFVRDIRMALLGSWRRVQYS